MIDENKIIEIITEDKWMMDVLKTVKTLNLPDWWVCAGFVRSKIWDTLHNFSERTPIPDIDVIYFDSTNVDEIEEKKLEAMLFKLSPFNPWSVKNQARMHVISNFQPFVSSVDAISKFPETSTALGVKIDEKHQVILTAPYGISDVVNLIVKPTYFYSESKVRREIYENRITKKNWPAIWHNLKVTHI